jgi:hypothetical protein
MIHLAALTTTKRGKQTDCEAETVTDALQAKVLTDDEARRVAINIARLPELFYGSCRARRRRDFPPRLDR